MQWYLEPLKKYAVFSGRARRKEYWTFFLGNIILSFVVGMVEGAAGLEWGTSGTGPLSVLLSLALLIPGLAVGVRRLHDTSRSGWWMFIALVPIIGVIVLIVFWASEGHPGTNDYGRNPKEVAA